MVAAVALIAVAGSARFAMAQETAATGLKLTADPPRLLLGTQKETTIAIETGAADAPVADVRVYCSVGTIGQPQQSAPGRYTATYTAPEQYFPHLAIIAAVASVNGTPQTGHTVVVLLGQGDLAVKGKPNSEVSVVIGDRSFGPVQTDRSGQATVRVEVPPGHTVAMAGSQRIRLDPAPFSRILAVPLRNGAAADGKTATGVQVFVVTERGEPLSDAPVVLKTDLGEISKAQPLEAGVYSAFYKAPLGSSGRTSTVVATLFRHKPSMSKFDLPISAANAAQLKVEVEPAEFVAGGQPPLVRIAVLDESGLPVAGEPAVSCEFGSISAMRENSPGHYEVSLTLPDKLPDQRQLAIKVSLRTGEGEVTSSAALKLKPEAPEKVTLRAATKDLVASDGDRVPVEIRVSDRFGNPVDGLAWEGKAIRGKLDAVKPTGRGTYVAQYTPPLSYAPTRDTVSVKPRGAAEGAELSFALKAKERVLMLGAHLGFSSNFVALFAPMVAIDATLRGGNLLPGALLMLELGGLYNYGQAEIDSGPLAGQQFEHHLAAVPLALIAGYQLNFTDDVGALAGVGGVVEYDFRSIADSQSHQVSLGALAQLGLTWRLGPGEMVLKARYNYGGMQGGWGSVSGLAGYSFDLF
ncbi:MAG: hypothetical protein JXR83_13605 [Deltaproteobacteria bacterium]|nr:hypothetical protein [Deltaproteobacteria bacterium]